MLQSARENEQLAASAVRVAVIRIPKQEPEVWTVPEGTEAQLCVVSSSSTATSLDAGLAPLQPVNASMNTRIWREDMSTPR